MKKTLFLTLSILTLSACSSETTDNKAEINSTITTTSQTNTTQSESTTTHQRIETTTVTTTRETKQETTSTTVTVTQQTPHTQAARPTVTQQETTIAPKIHYKNCREARAAGVAPIRRGEPGYAKHLDRDNDGIACEK